MMKGHSSSRALTAASASVRIEVRQRVIADDHIPRGVHQGGGEALLRIDARVLDRVTLAVELAKNKKRIVFGVLDEKHAERAARALFRRHVLLPKLRRYPGRPRRPVPTSVLRRAIRAYRIEVSVSAEVKFTVDDGRGGVEPIVERVFGENFERGPVLEHHGRAIAAGDVDPSRGAHRRRKDVRRLLQPLHLIVGLASCRVEGRQQAVVGLQNVEHAVVQQR